MSARRITVTMTEAQARALISMAAMTSMGCEQDGPENYGFVHQQWMAGERAIQAIAAELYRRPPR